MVHTNNLEYNYFQILLAGQYFRYMTMFSSSKKKLVYSSFEETTTLCSILQPTNQKERTTYHTMNCVLSLREKESKTGS